MSWYREIKKAMPLPRAKNYPENWDKEHEKDNFYNTKERLDKLLGPEDREDPEGELGYIGHGSYGFAYESEKNPNKVIKYTKDLAELEVAKKIFELQKANGGFLPFITGIYEFQQIPRKNIARLVMEKVEPLNEYYRKIYHRVEYIVEEIVFEESSYKDGVAYLKKKLERGDYNFKNDKYSTIPEQEQEETLEMFDRALQMTRGLIALGFRPSDLHGGNVGFRPSGELVTLDYGYL